MPPGSRSAKRQKIHSLQSDENELQTQPSPPTTPRKPRSTVRKSSRGKNGISPKAQSSLPKKLALKTKSPRKDSSSQSLFTFFTSSVHQQRKIKLHQSQQDIGEEQDDLIQDDSPDERFSRAAVKNRPVGDESALPLHQASRHTTSSSQIVRNSSESRFPRPPQTAAHQTKPCVQDLRPWSERFSPLALSENAVHHKKVGDVRQWLEDAMAGRNSKSLLILKGASGTGKTTTLSLLSKAMDFDLVKWRNPAGSDLSAANYTSLSAQFQEFIGRAGKFGSLDISGTNEAPADNMILSTNTSTSTRQGRVLLVEEFPTSFSQSSVALLAFRSTIKQFLSAKLPTSSNFFPPSAAASESFTPLVLVISETLLSTNSVSSDSLTAHRLLGNEILNHACTTTIEFNPIATTFLAKALDLIIQKEARISGRRRTPGPEVLRRLGRAGDVRSAVASLEFLCLRGDSDCDWGGRIAFGKAKRNKGDIALTKSERDSLEMVTHREASLGLFHALGKVVYNKREEDLGRDTPWDPPAQPPFHLPQHVRLKSSPISVETLIDETGTDTQTFIAGLHENFTLSCGGLSSEDTLDSVSGCLDSLSDSDLLCPNWSGGFGSGGLGGGFGRGAFQGAGNDTLRQDEISFQIAVRGLLFWLPSPVNRLDLPTINGKRPRKTDAFKMFYPACLRIWRQQEEMEGLVDTWVSRFSSGHIWQQLGTRSTPSGTVESWNDSSNARYNTTKAVAGQSSSDMESLSLMSGNSARQATILERLPYLAKIATQRLLAPGVARELEKITVFRGVDGLVEGVSGEDDELDSITTKNLASPGTSPQSARLGSKSHALFKTEGLSPTAAYKLTLSDDDIED
ncbi:MAG: Cell cycle checkpoint protein rad17 [Trizodia sp. TS-e1964]|nr:MAG: Cell cycle checkpoint protein rad17 [Trizodia sp. TS-e1964]